MSDKRSQRSSQRLKDKFGKSINQLARTLFDPTTVVEPEPSTSGEVTDYTTDESGVDNNTDDYASSLLDAATGGSTHLDSDPDGSHISDDAVTDHSDTLPGHRNPQQSPSPPPSPPPTNPTANMVEGANAGVQDRGSYNTRLYVSKFTPNSARGLQEFFKTLETAINTQSTPTELADNAFMQRRYMKSWTAYVDKGDRTVAAVVDCCEGCETWADIRKSCIDQCRGVMTANAQQGAMTMFRSKVEQGTSHVLLVSRAAEIVDHFINPLKDDPQFVAPGDDVIKITHLRHVLTQALITCYVPEKAQSDFLNELTYKDHKNTCMTLLKRVSDKHHLSKMADISYIGDNGLLLDDNKKGHTVSGVTDGAGGGKKTGTKPKQGTSTPAPKGNQGASGQSKPNRWTTDDPSAYIPKGTCFKCITPGHNASNCSNPPWCPFHKTKGHTYDDCKRRKYLSGGNSGSTGAGTPQTAPPAPKQNF